MKIMVTGGSGFVGAHTVAALVAAGHSVRLLVRDPDKLGRALAPLGVGDVDVVRGDVTDPAAVAAALRGCEAVLHAANVFTFDPRKEEEMLRVNTEGTRLVLTKAREAACDPIVHVSSVVALYPATGTIPADPPMGNNTSTPYIRSKTLAEGIARELQEDGGPVVTTYPGSVWGPNDPGPGEMVHMMRQWLGNRWPFVMLGGALTFADVRWVAKAHAALFQPGQGPRRINLGGHWVRWSEAFARMRRLTGRALPTLIPTPAIAGLASGRLTDALQRVLPWRLPVSYESSWFVFNCAPTDDSAAERLAGPKPALEETFTDAVVWAVQAGQIPPALAGRLAART